MGSKPSKGKSRNTVGFDNFVESDSDSESKKSQSSTKEKTSAADSIDTRNYVYPFENLAFEGGGNKGLAYCGVVKEMEEMGMMGQVRRFAGTSAGAMTATLLAIGYSADEIEGFIKYQIPTHLYDHGCGYCSLLPNLIRTFGWNPGRKMHRWFGDCMYDKTGNRDATFREIYEKFGKELCVVVTNLSRMSTIYCHVKTTPDMPVALAVRMSLSIPGMFSATKLTTTEWTDVCVDGGLLCNYPIHCFDGWWLSLDPKDSFFNKLQPVSKSLELRQDRNRFGAWNEKTLGFLLYADDENEMYRQELDSRPGAELPDFPHTRLARAYRRKHTAKKRAEKQTEDFVEAMDAFFKVLGENDIDQNSTISVKELQHAFEDKTFTKQHRETLFGKNMTAVEAFELIRSPRKHMTNIYNKRSMSMATEKTPIKGALHFKLKEEISFQDVMLFFESSGKTSLSSVSDVQRCDVKNLTSFVGAILECFDTNLKRMFMTVKDIDRTVGINTGYLGTLETNLDEQDIDFMVQQGRRAFISYLKYYVTKHSPPVKTN